MFSNSEAIGGESPDDLHDRSFGRGRHPEHHEHHGRHGRRREKAEAIWAALATRFDGPGGGGFDPRGPFGPGGPFGGPGGFGGGPRGRRRRGDVKFVVLGILADGPQHGYELIRLIEERHGVRPSAGSIYPTLQLLEDGGFVTSETVDGKRVYTIADAGRELLARRADEPAAPAEDDGDDARHRVRDAAMKLGAAVMGARDADDATLEQIRTVLADARKRIYAILAEDES